jgi:hypothetical protein
MTRDTLKILEPLTEKDEALKEMVCEAYASANSASTEPTGLNSAYAK